MYSQTLFASVCSNSAELIYVSVIVPWFLVMLMTALSLATFNRTIMLDKLKQIKWLGPVILLNMGLAVYAYLAFDNHLRNAYLILGLPLLATILHKYLSNQSGKDDKNNSKLNNVVFAINAAYVVLATFTVLYIEYVSVFNCN